MSVRTRATSAGGGGADTRGFTIVVAASNSLDPTLAPAVYRCDGVADEIEANAAMVAVNAVGGGTVMLLDGRYNPAATYAGQSYISLRGNGSGTLIFVPNATFINAISFIDKVYWAIKDLRVDGNYANNPDQASADNQNCIYLDGTLVYGSITGCWLVNARRSGIRDNGTGNYTYTIIHENHVLSNRNGGIKLGSAYNYTVSSNAVYSTATGNGIDGLNYSVVVGNELWKNATNNIYADYNTTSVVANYISCDQATNGISLSGSGNTVTGNVISQPNYGVYASGSYHSITGNVIYQSYNHGIYLVTFSLCTVQANTIRGTATANTDGINIDGGSNNSVSLNLVHSVNRDGIRLLGNSDNNNLFGNFIHTVGGYGINVSAATCNLNRARENVYTGCTLGCINDVSGDTIMHEVSGDFVQFGGGSGGWTAPVINTSPGGIDIDANDEFAYAHRALPRSVQQIVRITVWGYSNVIEAVNNMLLRINANGGGSSEPWNTEPIDVANKPSVEEGGIVQYDVLHWVINATDDADLGDLAGADYLEILAIGEGVSAPDIATDALLGGYVIEYV